MKLKKLISCCTAAIAILTSVPILLYSVISSSAADIKVKSIYDNKYYTLDEKFTGYTVKHGVDVSKWQGDIDWNGLKNSGTQFAFIRLGYRGQASSGGIYIDDYFVQNIKNANAAGVPVGVYFFSQAINEKEAIAEANFCIKNLKDYNLDLPIVYDFEYGSSESRLSKANPTKEQVTKNVLAFLNTVKAAGYDGMVYASKYTLYDRMYMEQIEDDNYVWLAHYTSGTDYVGKYQFWQYSSKGTSPYVSSSALDLDFMFVAPPVTSLALSSSTVTMYIGDTTQLTLTQTPAVNSSQITWSSSDETVATVSDGQITAVSGGKCTITANSDNGKSASCTVTVLGPITNMDFVQSSVAIAQGQPTEIALALTPVENTNTITWSSSDNTIAFVDNGVVTGVSVGNATITAQSDNGLSASCVVTITKALSDYTVSNISDKVFSGSELTQSAYLSQTYAISASTTTDTILYSGPSQDYEILAELPEANTVNIYGNITYNDKLYYACSYQSDTEAYYGFIESDKLNAFKYETEALIEGTDYSATYSSNVNVGTANVTYQALSDNLLGTATYSFNIVPKDISGVLIYAINPLYYTGSNIMPQISAVYNGITLVDKNDYTLSYSDNLNAGTAYITVEGIGNYKGTTVIPFTILPISDVTVGSIPNQQYTGSAITPDITITAGNVNLIKDTDYTLSYSNNTEIGQAQVTAIGKGNYSFTITQTFDIVNNASNDETYSFYVSDCVYTGFEARPDITVTNSQGIDVSEQFSTEYRNNINAGTAYVDISGPTSCTLSFTIFPADISGASISIDASLINNNNISVPAVTVSDNNLLLTSKIDYNALFYYDTTLNKGYANIYGVGNYCSSTFVEFEISGILSSVDSSQFAGRNDIAGIILNNEITNIGEYAFYNCTNLTIIELSESVTSIEKYALYGCDSMESIVIPASVSEIGEYAIGYVVNSNTDKPEKRQGFVIYCYQNSAGEQYAISNGFEYEIIDKEPEPSYIKGDANGDEKVNAKDYALLQRYINGWDISINVDTMDLNADGKVNAKDYALLQRYINGWDVTF